MIASTISPLDFFNAVIDCSLVQFVYRRKERKIRGLIQHFGKETKDEKKRK